MFGTLGVLLEKFTYLKIFSYVLFQKPYLALYSDLRFIYIWQLIAYTRNLKQQNETGKYMCPWELTFLKPI